MNNFVHNNYVNKKQKTEACDILFTFVIIIKYIMELYLSNRSKWYLGLFLSVLVPHLAVFKDCSCFCTEVFKGPYCVQLMGTQSDACKGSTLHTVLSLWPYSLVGLFASFLSFFFMVHGNISNQLVRYYYIIHLTNEILVEVTYQF